MSLSKLVFKSTEVNFVVGLSKDVVGKITAGEDCEADDAWPNLSAWAYAHTLGKVYQSKPADVYERWSQRESTFGPLREGVMTLKGPSVPLNKKETKGFIFVSSLRVAACSCPKGHSYYFAGPKSPTCWEDGTFGKMEDKEEMIACLYDSSNIVFTNHKGHLLYVSRSHLKEEYLAPVPANPKRSGPTNRRQFIPLDDPIRRRLRYRRQDC